MKYARRLLLALLSLLLLAVPVPVAHALPANDTLCNSFCEATLD